MLLDLENLKLISSEMLGVNANPNKLWTQKEYIFLISLMN